MQTYETKMLIQAHDAKTLTQAQETEGAGHGHTHAQENEVTPTAQSTQGAAGGAADEAVVLDGLEHESLLVNLQASLRVHARHQFFGWTQGLLQDLIRHEVLVCALRNGEPTSFKADSFSTALAEPSIFSDMFRQDTSMVPHIIKAWEKNHYQPVMFELSSGGVFAGSALAREFNRVGATSLIAHGTYDASGKLATFFVFAGQTGSTGPKQAHVVELVVPFLHAAWMRTQINRPVDSADAKTAPVGLLTSRELEILKWIYLGKSNIEIGLILAISPLTVKNHVQKILRRLNVRNRTQAVGKGLALCILTT
jgi:transcriptional regulator EpsA